MYLSPEFLILGSIALGVVLKYMGRPVGDGDPDPEVVLCGRAGTALLVGGGLALLAGFAL